MEKASIDAPSSSSEAADGRSQLSAHLGTTDVAVTRYRLAPGDGFPGGLHAHADQEEVFVVLDGEATFEVYGTDDGSTDRDEGTATGDEGTVTVDERTVTVDEGEAIRFARGEFKSGTNDADGDLVALAIGAPRDSEDVRVPLACPECNHGDVRPVAGTDGVELVCPDCGAAHVPQACPGCGHEELDVALDDGPRPVAVCPDCGTDVVNPLIRD